MVYRDISYEKTNNECGSYQPILLDRFFSFLIDYLLISPFVFFLLYLLFQDSIQSGSAFSVPQEGYRLGLLLGGIFVILFSLLQSAFIVVWKATPGQYFLKIWVVFENGNQLLFLRAFIRQIGFWGSLCLLGVPWIALISHPRRQTFYDRWADCLVRSKKPFDANLSDLPSWSGLFGSYGSSWGREQSTIFWRSFSTTLMIFALFLLIGTLRFQYLQIVNRAESFSQLSAQNFFCNDLTGVALPARLPSAIAMNLVGQLSNECLEHEADFVLWHNPSGDTALAYFAKALTEDIPGNEKKYLDLACVGKASQQISCQLAKTFTTGDFEALYKFSLDREGLLPATLSYQLSLMLGLEQQVQLQKFNELSRYSSAKLVKKFLLSEIISQNIESKSGRTPASQDNKIKKFALGLVDEL